VLISGINIHRALSERPHNLSSHCTVTSA